MGRPAYRRRWYMCAACNHVDSFTGLRAESGKRLRDQRCKACGKILGRGANARAAAHFRKLQNRRLPRREKQSVKSSQRAAASFQKLLQKFGGKP